MDKCIILCVERCQLYLSCDDVKKREGGGEGGGCQRI